MDRPAGGYFEDLSVGETVDCGTIEVTEEEMRTFASRYDPQPFHLDPERASQTRFGEPIASGWLTCALTARLLVDSYLSDIASRGGTGIDELRWHRPVYAGDELSVTATLVDKDRGGDTRLGRVAMEIITTNRDDSQVLSMIGHGLVEKRP